MTKVTKVTEANLRETPEDDMFEGLLGRGMDQWVAANVLQTAVKDCKRILVGQPGVAPTGGEVVNALSAIQFLRSRWGQKLADVMTGAQGANVARDIANKTARALGVQPEWVDKLPSDKLRKTVGVYGDSYKYLPQQAKDRLDSPSFRFA